MKTRDELKLKAKEYFLQPDVPFPCSTDMVTDIMADFILSLQEEAGVRENRTTDLGEPYPPNDQTFTVRALRDKLTGIVHFATEDIDRFGEPFERVEVECRVTKIIEP